MLTYFYLEITYNCNSKKPAIKDVLVVNAATNFRDIKFIL